jgi:hypothetical protein
MDKQGKQANFNGKMLEEQVISIIKAAGYVQIKKDKEAKTGYTKYFITQCFMGDGVYNTKLYSDVVLYNSVKYPEKLAIEMKWQQTPGSVDEKYPYLVLNIKEVFECPAIIVIDGEGYKRGALDWLKDQKDDKLIEVFNLTEFLKWSNSGGI